MKEQGINVKLFKSHSLTQNTTIPSPLQNSPVKSLPRFSFMFFSCAFQETPVRSMTEPFLCHSTPSCDITCDTVSHIFYTFYILNQIAKSLKEEFALICRCHSMAPSLWLLAQCVFCVPNIPGPMMPPHPVPKHESEPFFIKISLGSRFGGAKEQCGLQATLLSAPSQRSIGFLASQDFYCNSTKS